MPEALTATLILIERRTLPTVLKLSREWHRKRAEMQAEITNFTISQLGKGKWTAGLPDWSKESLSIVVLKSREELADEGRNGPDADGMEGLDHCVEGYSHGCEENLYRIVSIRENTDGTTRRLSTAQIMVSGNAFTLTQHRARKNAEPDDQSITITREYLAIRWDWWKHCS